MPTDPVPLMREMNVETGLTIAGIPIPFHGAALIGIVALHFVAGLGAVVTGVTAMLSRKGAGQHPSMGVAYFWCLFVVCVSMSILAATRWPLDIDLLILGMLALASASIGRAARRRRLPGWVPWHVGGMGLSYVLMLTAFYVDNGPHLPIWDHLPPVAYWTVPALVGVPLIVWAARRHQNIDLPNQVAHGQDIQRD